MKREIQSLAITVFLRRVGTNMLERNAWLFRDTDPTVDGCKATFKKEMKMVILRSKKKYAPAMEQ
jgi:hypothetical protein